MEFLVCQNRFCLRQSKSRARHGAGIRENGTGHAVGGGRILGLISYRAVGYRMITSWGGRILGLISYRAVTRNRCNFISTSVYPVEFAIRRGYESRGFASTTAGSCGSCCSDADHR
jgi:hypothetical protein